MSAMPARLLNHSIDIHDAYCWNLLLFRMLKCVIWINYVSFFTVNLSVNKSADMSTSQHSDKWLADEAVDGDVSQDVQDNSCAVTMYGFTPEAWWRVDLGAVYVINSVRIYNRREIPPVTFRLSGFSLYVSDTSKWENGVLCYQNNNGNQNVPWPSEVLIVPCNATGRFVTLYKQRYESCNNPSQPQYCTQLELCEVQVLGCENGTYGSSCENNCSGNCLSGQTCNKAHGGCDNGCAAGYYGFRCDQVCNTGFFGLSCASACGKCFDSSCYHVDGLCPYGCIAGWKGLYCSETCDSGTYGVNCEQECSQYCSKPGQCYSTNGTCYGGCQTGWVNDNCNQSCNSGFFGLECSSKCNVKCFNSFCSNVDGSCHHGCIAGWKGFYCNETCDDGEFGPGCSKICSEHCFEGLCDGIYGACHYGCIDGWTGDLCNEGCRRGFYGPNCSIACLECSESCHHRTGECLVVGKDISSSANNNYTIVIILIVTNVLTVIALVTAVALHCRHVRNTSNNSPTQQTTQSSSYSAQLPSNRSGRSTDYQPGTGSRSIENTENRTYEGLQMNSVDTNTYQTLQKERNVTYTNTQLI